MSEQFTSHGKQVLRNGDHYADALHEAAAAAIARGCNLLVKVHLADPGLGGSGEVVWPEGSPDTVTIRLGDLLDGLPGVDEEIPA